MSKKKKPRKKIKKRSYSTPLKILFFFGSFLLIASFFESSPATEKKTYSEIKAALRADKVKKVWLSSELIGAELKTPGTKQWVAERVGEDATLIPLLEEKDVVYESKAQGDWLKDFLLSWVIPIIFLLAISQFFFSRLFKQGTSSGIMSFGKSRAKLVDQDQKERITFADVAGCDEVKEELQEIISFLKSSEKYLDIGGKIPKGVLLMGPPGTGKTLIARAVAGEANVSFFQISGSDFVEMFVGVGAARVRDLFSEAQKKAPCIVFIDELDAVAKSRSTGLMTSNDERESTLNQILVEMDGFDNHSGVIIMAATNRPEVLDPAIMRPGRFDRQILVDRPGLKGREEILKVHTRNVKIGPGIDYKEIASRTPMFSGADLANLVNEAALLAVRKGYSIVTRQCFEEAIDRVVAGLASKSRILPESEKRTVAYHEVGHAVVAHFSGSLDKVHRISIIPRSNGALGYTMQIPEEERHLLTTQQLRSKIKTLLGGRAAEKVFIGDVTTGAHDDLKRASDIIRRMISEFGMSETLGLVSLGQQSEMYQGNPFIKNEHAPISENTAQLFDQEMKKILEEEFESACEILEKNAFVVEKMTAVLLEKETIENEEIQRLFASLPETTEAKLSAFSPEASA
ncbi:MAG: ATP-dependent zinc metalloprotease FtsH [Bdellovibrionota bacterium]